MELTLSGIMKIVKTAMLFTQWEKRCRARHQKVDAHALLRAWRTMADNEKANFDHP
jgi:hypothetical protein